MHGYGNSNVIQKCFGVILYHDKNWEALMHAKNGILLPRLFWPTVRKKCSSDQEKKSKFKAEGLKFSKNLRPLEQFIQTVKGQNNFW